MRSVLTRALTLVLFAALAGVPSASATGAATPGTVTISARPLDLARDRRLTLYGTTGGGAKEIVTLEARDCGQAGYLKVADVETVFGGSWSWEFFYPGITADVRAVWRGRRSAPVTIRDRAFVELRPRGGGSYVVGVRAKFPFVGRRVELQRLRPGGGGWTTLRTARLQRSGAPPGTTYVYSTTRVRLAAPAGSLIRAVFPRSQAAPCYLAGYSNLLRV